MANKSKIQFQWHTTRTERFFSSRYLFLCLSPCLSVCYSFTSLYYFPFVFCSQVNDACPIVMYIPLAFSIVLNFIAKNKINLKFFVLWTPTPTPTHSCRLPTRWKIQNFNQKMKHDKIIKKTSDECVRSQRGMERVHGRCSNKNIQNIFFYWQNYTQPANEMISLALGCHVDVELHTESTAMSMRSTHHTKHDCNLIPVLPVFYQTCIVVLNVRTKETRTYMRWFAVVAAERRNDGWEWFFKRK